MDDKTESMGPEYDLDLLRKRAIAAGFCLDARRKARAEGQPLGSDTPLLEFGANCAPGVVLLALYRLEQATVLLDSVKSAVPDLALRKQVDAFLSGVLTQQDMLLAWPYHAARLKAEAKEATAAKAAEAQP